MMFEKVSICFLLLIAISTVCLSHSAVVDSSEGEISRNTVSKRQANDGDQPVPPYIEILRGRDGRDGHDGEPAPRGLPGSDGKMGLQGVAGIKGEQGLPGPRSGGVTYVRWGRTTCSDTTGTEVVYAGRAAGSHKDHSGGTNEYLCLPEEPEYSTYTPGIQARSPIHGAEYRTGFNQPLHQVHNQNVPCVVCCTVRVSVLTIPARTSCPATWTLEYSGYLMTGYFSLHRHSVACVDKDPEAVRGEAAVGDGALFQHTEATCNGIDCPPYDPQKELTCAVCTK